MNINRRGTPKGVQCQALALVSCVIAGCGAPDIETDAADDSVAVTESDAHVREQPGDDVGHDTALSDAGTTATLVDHHYWEVVSAEDDVFSDRPDGVECDERSATEEGGAFEVETGPCPYITAVQPSLAAVAAGDTVRLEVWHLQLASLEPAEAHIAIMLGDEMLLDERIPIPSPANVLSRTVEVAETAATGTPVTIHLHNHGYNSWKFGSMHVHRP